MLREPAVCLATIAIGTLAHAATFYEVDGVVSMEAEHFTRRHDRGGAGWRIGEKSNSSTSPPSFVPGTRCES